MKKVPAPQTSSAAVTAPVAPATNKNSAAASKNRHGKLSLKLLKYETVNQFGNIFSIIFGFIFPMFMALLIANAFGNSSPDKSAFHTQIFINMTLIIPMATVFLGHAVTYSNELETGAILRLKLFGYRERTIITAKIIAFFLFLTAAFAVYTLVLSLALDLKAPSAGALFTFIIFFYVYSVILFLLGHAIATLCGRFGITFGVVMFLYFAFMILGGNMGINPTQLPDGIRHIAMCLPAYHMYQSFYEFWTGGAFNFLPFLLSTLGLAAVSVGVLLLSIWLTKKGKINQSAKPVYYD